MFNQARLHSFMPRLELACAGILFSVAALSPQGASAQAVSYVNERPVTIVDSVGQPSLQSIIDGEFGAGWGSAASDQSIRGVFKTSTASGTGFETIIGQYGGAAASSYKFGIWFGSDSSNLVHRDLFLGAATAGYSLPIKIAQGQLKVFAPDTADCGVIIQCGTLNNAAVDPKQFGFYFENGGVRRYTADSLNPASESSVLSFSNPGTSDWVLAYEDGIATDGKDFNDYVISVASVAAVPEPAEWMMISSGVALLAVLTRRRRGPGLRVA